MNAANAAQLDLNVPGPSTVDDLVDNDKLLEVDLDPVDAEGEERAKRTPGFQSQLQQLLHGDGPSPPDPTPPVYSPPASDEAGPSSVEPSVSPSSRLIQVILPDGWNGNMTPAASMLIHDVLDVVSSVSGLVFSAPVIHGGSRTLELYMRNGGPETEQNTAEPPAPAPPHPRPMEVDTAAVVESTLTSARLQLPRRMPGKPFFMEVIVTPGMSAPEMATQKLKAAKAYKRINQLYNISGATIVGSG